MAFLADQLSGRCGGRLRFCAFLRLANCPSFIGRLVCTLAQGGLRQTGSSGWVHMGNGAVSGGRFVALCGAACLWQYARATGGVVDISFLLLSVFVPCARLLGCP